MQRNCEYCQKKKVWVETDRKLKDGTKVYLDIQGRRWAGKRCPECERKRVKDAFKYDDFEKNLICSEIQKKGWEILSSKVPFDVVKDGKIQKINIIHASTHAGQVVLEDAPRGPGDLFAMVFHTVRFCTAAQIEELIPTTHLPPSPQSCPKPQPWEPDV
jgi:hypothetical protein